MWSLRRFFGGGIPDKSSNDSTWEGGGNKTVMDHPGRGGWASDFQDDLPVEGRPAELTGGGMPGLSGDEGGNTGALPAPAFPQQRGYYGGGKPTPPTVLPMQHDGTPTGPERQAPGHGPVCHGGEAEEATSRRGRDEEELGAGLRGTW